MFCQEDILLPVSSDDYSFEGGYMQAVKADNYVSIVNFISSFNDLEDNWDGYGAIVPSDEAINNSKKFIALLDGNGMMLERLSVDDIGVTPYGTIVLEWFSENGDSINVEIGNSKIGLIVDTGNKSKILLNGVIFDEQNLPNEFVKAYFDLF